MAFGLNELGALITARNGAQAQGISIEQYVGAIEHWSREHETQRSDNESRIVAKSQIWELFHATPEADFDPREVVSRVGLKNCQADRAFVSWQLKQARLTYQSGATVAK